MLKKWLLHPFLVALYPVLALLSTNVSQVKPADSFRAMGAALLLALVLLMIFRLLLRDLAKAGLLASVALGLFFSYGHVFSLLQGISLGPLRIGRTAILLPLWGLIFLACAVWLIRKKTPFEGTRYLNLFALVLIALPFYNVISYSIQAGLARRFQRVEEPSALTARFSGRPPDVYYIILDMHARADVLKTFYDYDDSWFVAGLKQRGFYIAEQSTSNYSSTRSPSRPRST